jgi:two-component system copper resistance phosphate regulon response regulator CusR
MKVLIIDDDVVLAGVLREGLSEEGHVVAVEHDGISGELAAQSGAHDAIVLDVMIPGKNGFAVLASLRKSGLRTPVLMLTARDTAADAITGLDGGADDYLRKPFAFGELLARLRSITRREPSPPRLELRVEDVVLDLATRRVTRAGTEIQMTAREVAYLEYFMRNAGLLITRTMIETALWTHDAEVTSNVIDVYIRRLRAKLTSKSHPSLLHTVRGAGYRFGLLQ